MDGKFETDARKATGLVQRTGRDILSLGGYPKRLRTQAGQMRSCSKH